MPKPVVVAISATWDDGASTWSGHYDGVPAAPDASTLDEVGANISAMALDLLPENNPGVVISSDHCAARVRAGGRLIGPQFDEPLHDLLRAAGSVSSVFNSAAPSLTCLISEFYSKLSSRPRSYFISELL
jgi:hypothetical protein